MNIWLHAKRTAEGNIMPASLEPWLNALLAWITVPTIVSVIVFVAGSWLKAKIDAATAHTYDERLEGLKARLQRSEEEWKAGIKARDEEMTALRDTVLTGMTARHAALATRRLQAIERLWAAAVDRGKLKVLSQMMSVIKMDVALETAAKGGQDAEKLKAFANTIWTSSGAEKIMVLDPPAEVERPFVTPMAWATFSALQQTLSLPVAQISLLRVGVGKEALVDPKPLLDLLKEVLPTYKDYIDKFGTDGISNLVEPLQERLLAELVSGLDGQEHDDKAIVSAVDLLSKVGAAAASMKSPTVDLPDVAGLRREDAPKPS